MKAMTQLEGVKKMVSLEPIMDFDPDTLLSWIDMIKPDFVSIGADSKGHQLPEPPATKIQYLVEEMVGVTTERLKTDITRLTR